MPWCYVVCNLMPRSIDVAIYMDGLSVVLDSVHNVCAVSLCCVPAHSLIVMTGSQHSALVLDEFSDVAPGVAFTL